ncbi:uncharacterized protein F4817DRAFT_310872 [Daldinia loculata]|uniref:uncharacterized protein n=1 Tax=Daldinia loculata TaxID=103429 RepID=UPI0020C46B72|nr:uncharacterized protein F4817DRAFT_310872 [Daldinia loculata]KAI1651999.1 hypothetical protein F4817DRAFT_310872 [Daldinia loculata]
MPYNIVNVAAAPVTDDDPSAEQSIALSRIARKPLVQLRPDPILIAVVGFLEWVMKILCHAMQHRQPRRRSVRKQSITIPRRAAPTQLHRQTKDRTPLTTGTIVVHMRHRHRCRRVCEQLITTLCCVTGWPPVQLGLRGGNAVPCRATSSTSPSLCRTTGWPPAQLAELQRATVGGPWAPEDAAGCASRERRGRALRTCGKRPPCEAKRSEAKGLRVKG